MNNKTPAVGIDLGTTFSVVACLDATNKPETIRNSEGDLTTASVVFFDRERPIVGKEALKVAATEPENVVRYAKREVGKDFFHQPIRDEQLPPEVIQALILKKLKEDAELKLGTVTKAVVTVPAFFNEPRRKSTQDAGQLAGLEVIDIINEPTAAAIAYGVQQGFLSDRGGTKHKERILIYDLGGGTFDVTLLDIDGYQYTAIATAGDVFLGGIDWDRRIIDFASEQFQKEHGVDPREDAATMQSLMDDAEDAKRSLSQRESVSLSVNHNGLRLRVDLTRSQFESMTQDLVQRTLFTTQKLLDRAKSSWQDLTRVLLVGGSSRMPMIQQMLAEQTSSPVDRSLDPDECVAHGAAIYAKILLDDPDSDHPQIQVTNVNSHDLGVLGMERATGMSRRKVLLDRNTPLPATGSARFTTREDNQKQVSVDVIEGGDASGKNSTPIGRCLVKDLPVGLPAGTPVSVRFTYTQNGRLEVAAAVTGTEQATTLVLERTSGLSDDELSRWENRICQGFAEETLAASSPFADLVEVEETPNIIVEPIVTSGDDEEILVEAIPVISDNDEEILVEPTPVPTEPALADTDQDVATDDTGEDFLAALAGTIDNEEEEKPSPQQADESAESVDADLNDFFNNFD